MKIHKTIQIIIRTPETIPKCPPALTGMISGVLMMIWIVLVIFTIFAVVRLHVQLVRFGRFVWRERAFPGRALGFICAMRHLKHAKTNRTSNGARTKKW